MTKPTVLACSLLVLAASQAASAAVSNVTGNGEGDTKEAAIAKAQQNLEASCTSFRGTAVEGSLKVTFEKPLSNGKVYVDATMQCEIP